MIPSIASRLDILADIADQMEHNEENTSQSQQQLLFQYLLQSIQKQKQDQPVDFSTKLNHQLTSARQEKISHPFATHSSSNVDLQDVYKRLQQAVHCSTPPVKRAKSSLCSPDLVQTDGYSERRKKNNEAAKRSRDARRVKEDEIAMRATWLEQENVKLRIENAQLKQENIQLRCHAYNSTVP